MPAKHQEVDCVSTQRARHEEDTPTSDARRHSDRQAVSLSRQLSPPLPESMLSYRDLSLISTECSHCKSLHFVQERVVSSYTARPVFSTCSGMEKLKLPLLADPPTLLSSLLTEETPRARRVQKNIRALSMASVVAKWVNRGPGLSKFNPKRTMKGEMYHYMGPMMLSEGRATVFCSVYIHDTDFTTQMRTKMGSSRGLQETLMTKLTHVLHECNPYV